MSTAPPTTAVPTTLAATTLAPTTPPPVEIEAGPIEVTLSYYAVTSSFPAIPEVPNPALDQSGSAPPIEITLGIEGEANWVGLDAGAIDIVIGIEGTGINGAYVDAGAIDITIGIEGDVLLDHEDCNWIKWSKIGQLDFTRDESNEAGKRPLDWKGCIYHIGKLVDKVVAYGENGVTILKPSGIFYGMETIYRIGLKNKGAFAGSDGRHFFVDKLGQLFQLDNKLTKLDYKEFISPMGTVILTYDKEKELLYICDDTYGFVYSVDSKSLGKCPANITGIGSQGGTLYVTSDAAIVTPKFEICTDVYDLGVRKQKTIQRVEVGTNLTDFLYMSVDYRVSYKDDFRQIGWFLVNPDGRAYPKCYGVEFRFRLKSTIYEYFEIDYLRVRGHIHGYSYLDQG